jgi:hypothetical protein
VIKDPEHVLDNGVTVIVAMMSVVEGLTYVNAGILPVPIAGKPISDLSLVQLNTVPGTLPEKTTAVAFKNSQFI